MAQETLMTSLGAYFHFFISLSSLRPSHPRPLFIVPHCQLLAPTIHPMSSGSQGWVRVLGRSLSLGLLVHGCGGCPLSFVVVVPLSPWLLPPLPVVPVVIAPHFHPASSCSWRRLRVPLWCLGCCFITTVRRPVIHPASSGSHRWCR
jgi:hypothetical protein